MGGGEVSPRSEHVGVFSMSAVMSGGMPPEKILQVSVIHLQMACTIIVSTLSGLNFSL